MFSTPTRLGLSHVLRSIGGALLTAFLLAVGPPLAAAQQAGDGVTPHARTGIQAAPGQAEALPPALKKRLPEEMVRRLRKARRQGGTEAGQRPKAIGGLPEVGPSQSWTLNENPNPSLNFDLTGTPQFAGDVNGDGTNDYLYATSEARDERTPDVLEDVTGKTALFFGGAPEETEDQFVYAMLHPVGDLNDDGFDDAIQFEDGAVRFWAGSPSGYDDTGTTISNPFGSGDTAGFTDLDGDGFEDVVVSESGFGSEEFAVIYGSNSLSEADVRTYDNGLNTVYTYNAADLDEDGSGSVVRLARSSPNMQVQVLGISGDRSLTVTQTFQAEELEDDAFQNQLSLIDITGNDTLEIATKYRFGTTTYVFERDAETGAYVETPSTFGKDAVPVGDLDGDGRHDFYTVGETTGTRYVSYGPSDLSQGLSLDTEIPYAEAVDGRAGFIPEGRLGDVTGDGRADVGLGLTDYPDRTVGRRFFSVNSDRTGRAPVDVTYPRGHFFDRIDETNEIGDFNDDGTTDLAMVRNSLGRVEVFYGGDPISQEPDLTITPPADSLYAGTVSSGDFDGDGVSDLLIGYGVEGRGFDALRNDIYLGGNSPDATSDHTVLASDVGFPIHAPRAIGDVNNDGATDWMTSDRGFNDGFNVSGQNVAIFFGGSALPNTPDQTLQYPDGRFLGEVSAAVGDVNGDGVDDFAFDNTVDGHIAVFFGGTNPSFSPPADLALPVEPYAGIAGGDFNGDGSSDIAAVPQFSPEGGISVFHGGPDVDSLPDQRLPIPAAAGGGAGDFDGDGFSELTIGVLESAGDVDGNGADELIHGSSFFGFATNALLYRPSTSSTPLKVFRAPNQDAALGAQQFIYSTAIGDFTGDGTTDFVGTQFNDNNDAAFSSRIYRYEVTASPIEEGTIADARQQGPDSMVTVQGTVTRAHGSYLRFQDESGPTGASALVVRQTSDDSLGQAFRDDIADGTIQPGTQIEVTGTLSAFAGLLQVNDDGLADYEVLGQGDPPAPQFVTLAELSATGEDYESELVTAEALLFPDATGTFENGTTYSVSGGTGGLAFRVQDTTETTVGGTTIPENLFTYTGVVGQFNDFSGEDRGYQLLPVRSSDLDEQTPTASSTVTVEKDSIYEFGGTGTRISFANTSGSGPVTVKRFGTSPAGDGSIPEANVSEYRYRIEAPDSLGIGSAQVRFDVSMLPGVGTPSDVKVYTRGTPGQGRFSALPVSYADSSNELVATTQGFSEFAFASDNPDNPLPVELAGFDATVDGDAVRLTWQTASEAGNARFEVQRRVASTPGVRRTGEEANGRGGAWTTVGSVEGAGTTSEARSYRYTDQDLPYEADRLEYRLRQVDADGSAQLSETITVERSVDEVELLGTYPNPAQSRATVRYALPEKQKVSLRLYDVLGRQVRTVVRGEQSGRQKRRVDVSSLASGVYFLRLRAGEQTRTQKLTIVR